MKLKYYLRGLGIGIIVTTLVLMISFALHKTEMSDEEIIKRAEQLGMVMQEKEPEMNASELLESSTAQKENNTENNGNKEESPVVQPESTEDVEDTENVIEDSETADSETSNAGNAGSADGAELYTLVVQRGEVCRTVCEDLQANGVIDDAEEFRKYLGSVGFASSIGAGTYEVGYGLSYEEIYMILKAGPLE